MSHLIRFNLLNLKENKSWHIHCFIKANNDFKRGVNFMTSQFLIMNKKSKIAFIVISFLLNPIIGMAQNYNFKFYNGNVSEQSEETQDKPKETVKTPQPQPQPAPTQIISEKKVEEKDSEKLRRTGIGFIAGYSQNSFRETGSIFKTIENRSLRAGLSFISSYDFNLDLEFLSNSINAELSQLGEDVNLKGRVPGMGIGIRNTYWLAENIGISLGGNIKGIKGTLSSSRGDYNYKSYGASLSAGPTFQIGKAQILLAYEHGFDNVQLDRKNNFALKDNKWIQNSTIKGMISYRF